MPSDNIDMEDYDDADFEDINYGDIPDEEKEDDQPQPKEEAATGLMLRSEVINVDIIKANIKAQGEILDALVKFVMPKLIPGKDYFSVKEGQLPSLGKSGAEKTNFIFRLVPRYIILKAEKSEDEVAYRIECRLYNKVTKEFSGAGVGSCSSLEDKFAYKSMFEKDIPKGIDKEDLDYVEREFTKNNRSWTSKIYKVPIQNHINIDNNILKMAKKRAYVDATLSATMSSFLFTQDLEDMEESYLLTSKKKFKPQERKPPAQQPPVKPPGSPTEQRTAPKPVIIPKKPAEAQTAATTQEQERPQYKLQELDPDKFTIWNKNSPFYGKKIVECNTWYLEGQIKWIEEGKFDPAKYGYDTTNYLKMYMNAIELRRERKLEKEGEEKNGAK